MVGLLLVFTAPACAQADRDLTASVASALATKEYDKALALLAPALKQTPQNPKL